MSNVAPGWYKDPADPKTQRFWDGEGWLGDPIPAEAVPPIGPPPTALATLAVTPPPGLPTLPQPPQTPASGLGAPAMPGALPGPGPSAAPPNLTHPAIPVRTLPPGPPQAPWLAGHPYARTKEKPRPHGLALAGVGSRFVARIVDILAVFGLCAVANAWFAYRWWQAFEPFMRDFTASQESGGPAPTPPLEISTLMLMMCAVTVAVWFAYEVPGSANTGQTLGKRLLGIKIVRMESEDRLGFGRAFRRWSRMGLPILLWSFWGIGFVLQFLDCIFVPIDRPLHQALHDKSAGTVVVRVRRPEHADSLPGTGSKG